MPTSEFRPPQALPVGTYHCLIDGRAEPGESKNQNKYLRFKFKILAPMGDVNKEQAVEQQVVGKIFTNDYVTDNATYRLTEMLNDHLGIEHKPLEQALEEAPGRQLLVKLKHELSQDGKRSFHRVESTAHV